MNLLSNLQVLSVKYEKINMVALRNVINACYTKDGRIKMKYYYSTKKDLLLNLRDKANDNISVLSCEDEKNHRAYAEAIGSSFGGGYPLGDIYDDSAQPGASLSRTLVLKDGEVGVACSRYRKFINDDGTPYIILSDLGVKKEYQGTGRGKEMFLQRLLYILKNESFEYIFSEIEDDNLSSIAISTGHGFKLIT